MIETSWHSYPSVFALGHRAVADILDGPVVVQEKIDGSQVSFGVIDGELKMRSKGADIYVDAPEGMFKRAVEAVRFLEQKKGLQPGYTYRGEYLQKPKHNALAYDRTPHNNIILFDINYGAEAYVGPSSLQAEAERLELESVPLIHEGEIADIGTFRSLLARESVLGGQLVEGVVVKNYARFGADKKVLMAKYVSDSFKEVHRGEWKKSNPGKTDVVQSLIAQFSTPARYQKAVQHLKERGLLEGSPRDIGALLKAAAEDIEKECRDEIAKVLYDWAWPQIRRGSTAGLPAWYKDELLKSAFEDVA